MATDTKFEGWLGKDKESVKGKMEWGQFEPKKWTEDDVDIEVSHCGICGSDLHMLSSGWAPTPYRTHTQLLPIIPHANIPQLALLVTRSLAKPSRLARMSSTSARAIASVLEHKHALACSQIALNAQMALKTTARAETSVPTVLFTPVTRASLTEDTQSTTAPMDTLCSEFLKAWIVLMPHPCCAEES